MKRKVTDLKPNEAILITNDSERDAILQLMEDAGYIWANRIKPTQWRPSFSYPLGIELDGVVLWNNELEIYEFMDFIIIPATDFIGSEGESVETLSKDTKRFIVWLSYRKCPFRYDGAIDLWTNGVNEYSTQQLFEHYLLTRNTPTNVRTSTDI
jgi:hypothetical protein